MRLLRWAYAVASAGTFATAPPRTLSCTARSIASELSMASTTVCAVAKSTESMNIVRETAVGW